VTLLLVAGVSFPVGLGWAAESGAIASAVAVLLATTLVFFPQAQLRPVRVERRRDPRSSADS
jgi:hypothetical protein